MEELPYRAEYAKSGRAKCKGCKSQIDSGELRLAVMVQSAFFDGKQANWYHKDCFFKKQHPASEGDIEHFASLRPADQKSLREQIASSSGVVLPSTSGKGKKRSKTDTNAVAVIKNFGIEYAKSGRAACAGCQQKILKDDVRAQKTVFDTEIGKKFGGQALWHHLECFAECRKDLGWFETGEKLPGFKSLSKEDQANVKKQLPAIKIEDIPPEIKKPKLEANDDAEKKLDEKIEKQMKKLFKYRDLIEKEMKKTDIHELLEHNHQVPRSDKNELLDMTADMLLFGALLPCEVCRNQLIFGQSGYICTGSLEWSKCTNKVKEPIREKCKIPDDLKESYKFLNSYKPTVSTRLIKYIPPSTKTLESKVKVKSEDETDSGPKVKREKPPLYNFEIAIIGIKDDSDLKKRIGKLGGKVVSKITTQTILVISTPEEVEKMGSKMKKAKECGVHVVTEEYLDAVKDDPTGAVTFIKSKSICDWGTDPHTRLPSTTEEKSASKSKSMYTKSVPKSMKLKLKGGLAVDPDSGLEDIAHVHVDKSNNKYSVVLGLTDVQTNKNSYYKIQLLESDRNNKYWIFRSWGRIGTTIGGNKLESKSSLIDAVYEFEDIYYEQTGNHFADQINKTFVKKPGKKYPIDIDYGDSEKIDTINQKSSVPSKLAEPVQDLIKLMFDIDAMKKVMMEFDLDMEKMPLGKLSQKQIQSAYKVLSDISDLIQNGETNNLRFVEYTNCFYTLIPHSFGIDSPPILNTIEQIKHHNDVLDSLIEIEFAYSMIRNENSDDNTLNPIDKHYEQLKTDIKPLDKESEEYKLIEKYVQNTHAETHRSYDLEICDVFKISRKGELRRFKPFKKLHNRKLLWHGSRLTNFAGILSHGLKIAPSEAPSTGYMFGKGIYFADMVSKSANYCCTSKQNSTGLILLSEVALGDMIEYTNANYVTKLPKNKHSVKGIGLTEPDPKQSYIRNDNVEIPFGKPVKNNKLSTQLLYNEYIVYDVAQVNIQYLLKLNFKYKY